MNDLTPTNTQTAVAAPKKQSVAYGFDMMNPAVLDHIWRLAGIYSVSPLVPEHLRKGGDAVARSNIVLAMNIAHRMNEDAMTVMQNIYFVSGKPGWSATYMISRANLSGAFRDPIDWIVKGAGESLAVTAFTTTAKTGRKVEITVSMDTARKEGWTSNKKYQSMPEVMLRYRSATALIRMYCPEVMLGIPSEVEIVDEPRDVMRDVTPQNDPLAAITGADEPKPAKKETAAGKPNYEVDPETGEVTEDDAPKKVSRAKPAPAAVAPKEEPKAVVEAEADPVADDGPSRSEPAAGISSGGDERPEPPVTPARAAAQATGATAKILNMRKAILADLESIGEAGAIRSFYAEQLETIRGEAPAILAELEEAFSKYPD
jgi:hypothetical protein